MAFQNPDEKFLKKQVEAKLAKAKSFDEINQNAIIDFHENHSLIECGLNGQIRNLYTLNRLVSKFKIKLSKLSENDLQKINKDWLANYSPSTRNREINTVKVFLRHQLAANGLPFKEKERIRFLLESKLLKKTNLKKHVERRLQAMDLLTQQEVIALIDHSNTKYKALWAMLWGTSARISAMRHLRRINCEFDSDGAVTLHITSKGMVNSVWVRPDLGLFLKDWLNKSPYKKQTDFVFPSPSGECLSENAILQEVRRAGKKAGITKKLYPHLFRHSSISELLNNGFNPVYLKKRAWNNEKSNQLESIYGHLDTRKVNQAFREFSGQGKPPEPPKFEMNQKICFSCRKANPFNADFCSCGMPLSTKGQERFKFDQIMNELVKDPTILQTLKNAILAKGLDKMLVEAKT